jgi:hypothetical protein
MANISSYPTIEPKLEDLIVGTETYVEGVAEVIGNPTRNFTVGSLIDLVDATPPPLEFNAGMIQSGTSAPNPTAVKQINTLEVSGAAYRFLNFTRVSTGTYNIEIIYSTTTMPTDTDKVSVSLGFGNCRIIAKTNINSGAQSTIRYTFETYTPAGVLADGQMTGANGGFLNIKLYS